MKKAIFINPVLLLCLTSIINAQTYPPTNPEPSADSLYFKNYKNRIEINAVFHNKAVFIGRPTARQYVSFIYGHDFYTAKHLVLDCSIQSWARSLLLGFTPELNWKYFLFGLGINLCIPTFVAGSLTGNEIGFTGYYEDSTFTLQSHFPGYAIPVDIRFGTKKTNVLIKLTWPLTSVTFSPDYGEVDFRFNFNHVCAGIRTKMVTYNYARPLFYPYTTGDDEALIYGGVREIPLYKGLLPMTVVFNLDPGFLFGGSGGIGKYGFRSGLSFQFEW